MAVETNVVTSLEDGLLRLLATIDYTPQGVAKQLQGLQLINDSARTARLLIWRDGLVIADSKFPPGTDYTSPPLSINMQGTTANYRWELV